MQVEDCYDSFHSSAPFFSIVMRCWYTHNPLYYIAEQYKKQSILLPNIYMIFFSAYVAAVCIHHYRNLTRLLETLRQACFYFHTESQSLVYLKISIEYWQRGLSEPVFAGV